MPYSKDNTHSDLITSSEYTYRNLIESVKNGIYMTDMQGRLVFVNQSFVEILGYHSKEELIGLDIAEHIYVDPQERVALLSSMKAKGFVRDYEINISRKDGSQAILSVTGNFICNDNGETLGVQGIIYDVTEKKLLEKELHLEKSKMGELLNFGEKISLIRKLDKLLDFIVTKTAAILEAGRCSLMLYDETNAELCIKSAKGLNEEIVTNTRLKLGESIAGRVAEYGHSLLVEDIEQDKEYSRENNPSYKGRSFMCASIKLDERLLGVINVADKKNGEMPFTPLDQKILSAVVTQSAIAIENAGLSRELDYLSVTDPLTQLANYRFFVNCVDHEIQRFKRFGQTFSLLVIDVDNFKAYNVDLGHMEGDLMLKNMSRLLTQHLRTIDQVCRYGGDEFVVLLPGTNLHQAGIVAEKLRGLVEKHSFQKPVTVSVGVCEYRDPSSRFDFILKGDRALYQAKRSGKNRVVRCEKKEKDVQSSNHSSK
jgi:diguanylate cyclase (GGDEF)-like protein/PAS domain S-box-containing protein